MDTSTAPLAVAELSIGLLGGLSIFLYGMEKMTEALKSVAGAGMRNVLAKLTTNRFSAAVTGALVTAVIQSSSVTTVLVVGFVSAGLMTLAQSVGVIMGANVGTTITAQIIAFKVTEYALLLVALGFGGLFLGKRDLVKRIGALVMGLGLIFLGMGLMSDATVPLRTYQPFIDVMQHMANPLLAILVAAAFTALVQSSSATTGIVIMLASQGFITLEAGIALAFGANVGTCATALLATLGKPRVAVRTALVHVIFNFAGVLVWLPFLGLLAEWVRAFSPGAPGLEGAAQLAAETPRQIANAHTLFNISNTLLFLPFTTLIARLVERLAPDLPEPERGLKPKYLDDASLDTPALALDRLRLEIARLGAHVHGIVSSIAPHNQRGLVADRLTERVTDARSLHAAIVSYSRQLLARDMRPRESATLERLLTVASDISAMADTIGLNLAAFINEWKERNLRASDETREEFLAFHDAVTAAMADAVRAVKERDVEFARSVVTRKPDVVGRAQELGRRIASRLVADDPERLSIYRLESQVIEIMKRFYYFAKRVAKTVIEGMEDAETADRVEAEAAAAAAATPAQTADSTEFQ